MQSEGVEKTDKRNKDEGNGLKELSRLLSVLGTSAVLG